MNIVRETTPERINAIVNDPSIYPWVKGASRGPLDVSKLLADPKHVVLTAEHGGIIFVNHGAGVYEFHASVLPQGRGQWMLEAGRQSFEWLFTNTDANEILTKCPKGNVAALAGARAIGMTREFSTRPIWPTEGGLVPVEVCSMSIRMWAASAPGLDEIGEEFHEWLEAQYHLRGIKSPIHEPDPIHNRYVGMAVSMVRGGQITKGVFLYNRWAIMSGYAAVKVVSQKPLVLDIVDAKIKFENGLYQVL